MKNGKIYAVPSIYNNMLSFFYVSPIKDTKHMYLYSVRNYKSLRDFFATPLSESQILGYAKWGSNYRIEHQIVKLPAYIRKAKMKIRKQSILQDFEYDPNRAAA